MSSGKHTVENKKVSTLLVPGTEDPSSFLKNGGMTLSWEGTDGRRRTVSRFREQRPEQLTNADLGLPSLYLDFLDSRFYATNEEIDSRLKAGNANSELRIVMPEMYLSKSSRVWDELEAELRQKLNVVLEFLLDQGEAPSNSDNKSVTIQRRIFSLVVARPKCDINIPKDKFGIPAEADLYTFAQNHRSVSFMDAEHIDAFEVCISELPDQSSKDLKVFAKFLKVFFEGGFAYNVRQYLPGNSNAYLPKNVGIAGLSVVPAFEGQMGIATGFPYVVSHQYLPFIDTVPVTIRAISEMSDRHARYVLCFTRCAFVWEGDAYGSDGILDFCCVLPHGGFCYAPPSLRKYKEIGGLVYAFGEDKESANQAISL